MFIDCDANATYALDARGEALLHEAVQVLGNPSSLHRLGQRARNAIEVARDDLRRLVGIPSALSARYRVVFTSGATEANNLLVSSLARSSEEVVSTAIEHPCMLKPLERLSGAVQGGTLEHRTVPPPTVRLATSRPSGVVDAEALAPLLAQSTGLVSLMAANNETGVLNPLNEIVSQVRQLAPKAVVHSDVAQVLGKVPFSMTDSQLDAITVSGHKFGAIAGVGALVIREDVALEPLILGGPQEDKVRGGTENVLGIVHMGLVARHVASEVAQRARAMRQVRDEFEAALQRLLPGCVFNGAEAGVERLPNTSSVWLPGTRADDLVVALDLKGILVSAGSACSSGKPEPSHVLGAMGQPPERVKATVRVSFRADSAEGAGGRVAEALAEAARRSGF